ncbi:MAG: DNA integrity scanning protein DisA nucleotide-binding domain protein, partial [Armatimonadota bacterium]
SSLLEAIFFGENPLHDGAAIIRGDKLIAAACRLPLSESTSVARHMHMRHRAGLGASEAADCVVIIVSEERGRVSLAVEGRMTEIRNLAELREALCEAFGLKPLATKSLKKGAG